MHNSINIKLRNKTYTKWIIASTLNLATKLTDNYQHLKQIIQYQSGHVTIARLRHKKYLKGLRADKDHTTISTYRKYHSSTYRKSNNPAIENTATSLAFPMCTNRG
jgi:hypothetical protein